MSMEPHEHVLTVAPQPVTDESVGASYLAFCDCPVMTTANHTAETQTSMMLDYGRGRNSNGANFLHVTGVELLNLHHLDELEKDVNKLPLNAYLRSAILQAYAPQR